MEDKILEILDTIINDISNETIPQNEREKIIINVNKNGSVSFVVFKNILLKITIQKTRTFIEFRKLDCIKLEDLSKKFEEIKYKQNELYIRVYINDINDINQVSNELKEIYKYLYLNEPVDNFGCCSRYIECSDALKCINPNKKLAKGCQYRENLKLGKIFYGKNKNI